MKIAILSKADKSGGGASRIAQELSYLLQDNGHTAHHYLAWYYEHPHRYARPLYGYFLLRKIFRKLNKYIKRVGFPDLIPWELFFLYLNRIHHYDLLHFHDLSSAISPLTVRYLARRIPTVWTFHDCSPFTGGCLAPLSCTRYKIRCSQCPKLGRWPLDTKFDFTGFLQDIKRKTAHEGRFTAVVPSTWLAKMAVSSNMFIEPPHIIPHGIDPNIFSPQDKSAIRKKLNLPLNRPIILLTAAYLHDELKGINFAIQALTKVKHLNPYVLLVGDVDVNITSLFGQFDYYQTGYIFDDTLKAQYFAAADIFLCTSLAESFSLVTLETMATATPSVSFATGGIIDLVEHNESGYLVPQKDVGGLVHGLNLALQDGQSVVWGQKARERVLKHYTHQIFLENHLKLYQQVIQNFQQ